MGETTTAYVGLGSNLGDRVLAIEMAVEKLRSFEETFLSDLSSLYETSPVDLEGAPFINAVAVVETGLEPGTLLRTLQRLETAMGRTRESGRPGSRIIDLDLLLYGDATVRERSLILPHPGMLHRRFVMVPLAELAPDLKIPPTGITASEAAADLAKNQPEQKVTRLGTLEEVKESSGV